MAGIRPAINIGISVSRVGGSAQTKAIRQVASRLRLDMAAYRELAAFALFASDLDKTTQQQISRGQRLQEVLKQAQYEPVSMENEVIVLFASINGFADPIPVERMKSWENELVHFMDTSHPEIGKEICEKKLISKENEATLRQALESYNLTWR